MLNRGVFLTFLEVKYENIAPVFSFAYPTHFRSVSYSTLGESNLAERMKKFKELTRNLSKEKQDQLITAVMNLEQVQNMAIWVKNFQKIISK